MDEPASWLAVTESASRAFEDAMGQDAHELGRRYEDLFARDPGHFRWLFDQANRCGDLKTIDLLGEVLSRHEPQDADAQVARATALLAQERYGEAAATFEQLWAIDYRTTRVGYGRAKALAGAGRLEEALAAAKWACQARPDNPRCRALLDLLLAMAPLHARRDELRSWSELRPLLQGYFELGLRAEAAVLLRRLMRDARALDLQPSARIEVAELALRVCPTAEVRSYASELSSDDPQRLEAIKVACDVLAGRPAPHCKDEVDPAEDKGLRLWRALACEASGELPSAIRQLSSLADDHKRDLYIRGTLARVVGRAVIEQARPRLAAGGSGKIVNVITFNNEFDLLRMHLEEMAPLVDRFVIVEAGQTFMGQDKPLHFQENRAQFADFADRIVHVTVPRFPDYATTAWARDFHQRDFALTALQGICGQEDYVLLTDADEIVRPSALDGFVGEFACLWLAVSCLFLNYRPKSGSPKATRPAAVIVKARHLMQHGLSFVRFFLARRGSSAYVVPDAGWHFTSVNDPDRIALKLGSYAHQEQAKERFRTPAHFREQLARIRAGEYEPGWERVDLDDRFPDFIQRNRSALAELIL